MQSDVGATGRLAAIAAEEARIAADWSVGGKLWEAKREKDRVARALLSCFGSDMGRASL